MSPLLKTLRLCFLFSILQLTVTTVAGENVPPVARIAEMLAHPRANLNRNLHIRQTGEAIQTCIENKQCKLDILELQEKCIPVDIPPEQVNETHFKCMCDEISKRQISDTYWVEFEQCENCVQKEGGNQQPGFDFSVEGPKLCKLLQGETTSTPDTPPTPTATTDPEEITTETTKELQTTITDTTEETTTPETANNQTTTIVVTEKSPTTVLTVVNKTTTFTTVDQTPEATSRGNSSTTRTGLPTPSEETDLPEQTDDEPSGAVGSITTAQHGFQTAVWAFGIKLVVVAAFNFIL